MKRSIPNTLIVLLLLALTSCVQVRDSWLPDPEPEPPVTDPVDPGTPEPGEATATLTFPLAMDGLPLRADGTAAVTRVEVTLTRVVAEADGVGPQETGDESFVLLPDEPLPLQLEPGTYGLESFGYGDSGQPIAYGKSGFTIEPDGEALDADLNLSAVIGSVRLEALPARESVVPGEELGFRLVARSVDPGLAMPQEGLAAEFQLAESLGELEESGHNAVIARLAPELPDSFRVSATGRGQGLVDGIVRQDAQFEAELELPVVQPADTGPTWLPPRITFDVPLENGLTLEGQVTDRDGHTHVQVFHGDLLLGSSRADEHLDSSSVAEVSISDGNWLMQWEPEAGSSYTLRAVAQDLHGNSSVAYQSLNVAPPADPGDLQTYRTVSSASGSGAGTPETFPDLGACTANEFSLPGQGLQAVGAGLQAVGAVGGLSYVPAAGLVEKTAFEIGKEHTAVLVKWPRENNRTIDEMSPLIRILGDVRDPVLILVVDDFGEGSHELPQGLLDGSLPPEQLQALAADGLLTHGALVLHHTLQNLTAMSYRTDSHMEEYVNGETQEPYYVFPLAPEDRTDPFFVDNNVPPVPFIVQPVNTAGRSVDELGAYIRQSIQGLNQFAYDVERILINFSFVIMPCSITADFAASGISSFEDYAEAVAAVNGMSGDAEQVVEASASGGSYGLTDFLACPSGQPGQCSGGIFDRFTHVVNVASAGNYGLDYPLFPAAEPGVIAVGSVPTLTVGHDTEKNDYSNSADILAPGSMILGDRNGDMVWRYDGTSFAAPNASTFLAGDLAVAVGMECFGEPNMEPDGPSAPGFVALDNMLLYDWYGGPEALWEVCQHSHGPGGN